MMREGEMAPRRRGGECGEVCAPAHSGFFLLPAAQFPSSNSAKKESHLGTTERVAREFAPSLINRIKTNTKVQRRRKFLVLFFRSISSVEAPLMAFPCIVSWYRNLVNVVLFVFGVSGPKTLPFGSLVWFLGHHPSIHTAGGVLDQLEGGKTSTRSENHSRFRLFNQATYRRDRESRAYCGYLWLRFMQCT